MGTSETLKLLSTQSSLNFNVAQEASFVCGTPLGMIVVNDDTTSAPGGFVMYYLYDKLCIVLKVLIMISSNFYFVFGSRSVLVSILNFGIVPDLSSLKLINQTLL